MSEATGDAKADLEARSKELKREYDEISRSLQETGDGANDN